MKTAIKVINIVGICFNILAIVGLVSMVVFKQNLLTKMQEVYNEIPLEYLRTYFEFITIFSIVMVSINVVLLILQLAFIDSKGIHIIVLIFGVLSGSVLGIISSILGLVNISNIVE